MLTCKRPPQPSLTSSSVFVGRQPVKSVPEARNAVHVRGLDVVYVERKPRAFLREV